MFFHAVKVGVNFLTKTPSLCERMVMTVIKRIEARFQTYDEAENCARIIKHQVPEVVSLRLKGQNQIHDTKEFTLLPLNNAIMQGQTYNEGTVPMAFMAAEELGPEMRIKEDGLIIVEIEREYQKAAEKIIRSNGGMHIIVK